MRRIHALALVLLFGLGACSAAPATPATTAAPNTSSPAGPTSSASGNPSLSASASPSIEPPANTGPALHGDGYTLTLPEGWKDSTTELKKVQDSVDRGGKNATDTKDGFVDLVTVGVQTSPAISFDQFQPAIERQLKAAGSTKIEFKDNVQLDGTEALQVWSVSKIADNAHTIQFAAFRSGNLYVVTVSTNLSDAKADTLAQQVISGWKWA